MTFELYCYVAAGAVLCALLFGLCSLSSIGVLQQSNYSGKSFLKWYCRFGNMLPGRYALLSLALVLLTLLFNVCFSFLGYAIANLISLAPVVLLCTVYICASRRALKVPLKRTARTVRLAVAYFILLFAVSFGALVGLSFGAAAWNDGTVYLFRYVPLCLMPNLLPFVLALANFLMGAYEVPRRRHFIRIAEEALAKSGCIKVGITGSFAKTSVKNMAAAILGTKKRVIATPASYNTPIGIARTVNEGGLDCDIFLAEMGARRAGDVKELCEMVRPDFGVITGICPQHLETFLNEENIVREKGTLAEYAKKGCVIGASAHEKGIEGALAAGIDFDAEEIVCTPDGTEFTLRLGGERRRVRTALLGRHCAEDIALASALCYLLGMSVDEIESGISAIVPTPHRLQKIEANGLIILDDSYNSNVEGAKDAVYTLRLMGGRKFVVTPGIVEMGIMQDRANEELGARLVGLDGVILVGETLVLSVRAGYLSAGGEESKLRVVPTLDAAQKILSEELRADDSVLFLNDLPDIYR